MTPGGGYPNHQIVSGRARAEKLNSALYRLALCVDGSSANLVGMVTYGIYLEDGAAPMGCLAWYHSEIVVSVWGMHLLRRNLPLILFRPDQQVQSRLRYALDDSVR